MTLKKTQTYCWTNISQPPADWYHVIVWSCDRVASCRCSVWTQRDHQLNNVNFSLFSSNTRVSVEPSLLYYEAESEPKPAARTLNTESGHVEESWGIWTQQSVTAGTFMCLFTTKCSFMPHKKLMTVLSHQVLVPVSSVSPVSVCWSLTSDPRGFFSSHWLMSCRCLIH